jgi:hypothetical protein
MTAWGSSQFGPSETVCAYKENPMSVDKPKDTASKKAIADNKVVEANQDSTSKTENKPDSSSKTESSPDAPASKQGMGEGQKAVSKAYKDNWNDIFATKKKKKR